MSAPRPMILVCIGSFNPVTNKHLRILELARDALHKTGLYTVIEGVMSPVHDLYGKAGLVEAKHRVEMLKLAIKSNDWLRVDTWETEQKAWTPTAITLDNMRSRLSSATVSTRAGEPEAKRKRNSQTTQPSNDQMKSVPPLIRLVCGADLLESFAKPGLWAEDHMEKIVRDYGLVVLNRNGANPDKFIYESDLLSKYSNNILNVTDWFEDDFSSTKVRRALKRNESVKYVIPDDVIKYIKENKLYNPDYRPASTNLHPIEREESLLCSGYYSQDLSPCTAAYACNNSTEEVYYENARSFVGDIESSCSSCDVEDVEEELIFSSTDSSIDSDSKGSLDYIPEDFDMKTRTIYPMSDIGRCCDFDESDAAYNLSLSIESLLQNDCRVNRSYHRHAAYQNYDLKRNARSKDLGIKRRKSLDVPARRINTPSILSRLMKTFSRFSVH